MSFIPPIKRRDDNKVQNYKVYKQNMYMTLEKTKHQSMLCTDNENKHIHNYIHNLDAK